MRDSGDGRGWAQKLSFWDCGGVPWSRIFIKAYPSPTEWEETLGEHLLISLFSGLSPSLLLHGHNGGGVLPTLHTVKQ